MVQSVGPDVDAGRYDVKEQQEMKVQDLSSVGVWQMFVLG